MRFNELENILNNAAQRDGYAVEDLIKTAAAVAEENILRRQEEAAYMQKVAYVRREGVREMLHQYFTKASAVEDAIDYVEDGGELPPEMAEELLQLAEESELEEEALIDALLEADDLSDEGAIELLDAAADDPELAAQLINEIDGTDVEPEEVDALSDAVAEAIIAEQEGDPSAKAAAAINDAAEWLANANSGAGLIVKEASIRKVQRFYAHREQ